MASFEIPVSVTCFKTSDKEAKIPSCAFLFFLIASANGFFGPTAFLTALPDERHFFGKKIFLNPALDIHIFTFIKPPSTNRKRAGWSLRVDYCGLIQNSCNRQSQEMAMEEEVSPITACAKLPDNSRIEAILTAMESAATSDGHVIANCVEANLSTAIAQLHHSDESSNISLITRNHKSP
ncbi:hypothetical protein NPIL_390631 [Nephila pilipes]|uniref:Uncharacterized protein n=1 Tax=Nephila pilipes TaxID=299642 RepID=A0A8X6MMI9_NEPPI|nr:hypothetical protein NPIL_390631 [Nephila pilipes]